MRAVLYTYDFEPITVIDVPEWAGEYLERYQCLLIPVIERRLSVILADVDASEMPVHTVRIECQKLCRRGITHWMLFTQDEESALLLRATLLPGQRSLVKEHEKSAFAKGFLEALKMLRGDHDA